MAKMKWDDLDDEALDGAEWDAERDASFNPYDGPTPPSNVILNGRVKKAWTATSKNGNPMIKILWEASGNDGEKKIYNGCPIWHQVVFMAEHPGLFKPFLNTFGLKASDVKNKTVVDSQEDRVGLPILKIAGWKPDSSGALCKILTKREIYKGEEQVRIARFMAAERDEDSDDEDEDTSPF